MLDSLVGFLGRHGERVEAYLDRVAIPIEVIENGGWVTKKQAYDLTHEVVKRTRCREAIFAAYLDFEFDHLGPIAEVMRSCVTVKEALEIGAQLGSSAYEGNDYFLRIEGDVTWFSYREPRIVSAGQTYINDMTLTVYCQLIRTLVDCQWRPMQMRIRRESIDRHLAVPSFEECRVEVHPEYSAIGFPTVFLSQGMPKLSAARASHRLPSGPEDSGLFVDSLYRLLASRFPGRNVPTLEQTSKMVGISSATLKRHLAAEGLNYRRLIDRVRFDVAQEMLSTSEITIKEIALELDFADTSNFARSFRRLTGMSPEKYRQEWLCGNASVSLRKS